MKNNFKKFIITINDFSLIIISTYLAYIIRFENIEMIFNLTVKNFIIPLLLYSLIFFRYSLYNQVVRFLFTKQINLYFKINLIYLIISSIIYLLFYGYLPRSIGIIQPLVFIPLFFLSRIIAFYSINTIYKKKQLRCFLVGINKESLSLLNNSFQDDYLITEIFENNNELINRKINTIQVNSINMLENFVKKKSPDIIISVNDNKGLLKKTSKIVLKYELRMKKIISTNKKHLYLDNYEIEELTIDDLFHTKIINKDFKNNFKNKNIIVTGAGGSIGKEIARQLINQNVKNLYLVDKDEFNLFNIHKELNNNKNINIHRVLIDLKEYNIFTKYFKNKSINYVFHAAAYKHVGIVEENYVSGFLNNIIITENVLKFINSNRIKNFVLISSDKSVRPTNLMGASKRICELLTYKYKFYNKINCNFSIVRFGNVINSTGSVIPIFKEQIENNKPLTITHKDVSRYFMSIPQAVNLVLHSSIICKGLKIYLLDMGKPIKILELAKKMLKVNGIIDTEKRIKFIGLGKGEKIEEELYKDFDYKKTSNNQINESLELQPNINKINNIYSDIVTSLKKHELLRLKKILSDKLISYEEKHY